MNMDNIFPCKICGSNTSFLDIGLILGKYSIKYYSCPLCGFIQTESPFWLEEAYSSAIAKSDIGMIGRNIKLSNMCSALIPLFFRNSKSFIDYGGGNGMFVRIMRDKGFDFNWLDKYSENKYAAGFEVLPEKKYSVLTAFEVFEHLADPIWTIDDMLRYSDTIIFSTRIIPYMNIKPSEWWYYVLDTGQHIALYSMKSLQHIAKTKNLFFSSNGISFHVLSRQRIPRVALKTLSSPLFAAVISYFVNIRRESLLDNDYFQMTGRSLR